jgi:hypothetical protein
MELKQPIYRGGNQFIAKTNEVKIEPKTGFLKPTNGISVNSLRERE